MSMSGRIEMKFLALFALISASLAAFPEEEPVSDRETWNLGVSQYRAGDFTNALETLKGLESSKTHKARAAELVSRILHDRAHDPARTGSALDDLEEASRYSQIALRAAPRDAKARRNFARAVEGVGELREQKRLEEISRRFNGRDPGSILRGALRETRETLDESASYRTNAAERAVERADALQKRMENLGEIWVAVNAAVAAAVTNEEEAATIAVQIDRARENTDRAAKELGDMEDGAYSTLSEVERDVNKFFKMTALPMDAISEDLVAQSNAWLDVENVNGHVWQKGALDFTRAFRAKFPAWARAYEQQAAADTNKPPFTAEAQAEISTLSTELEKLQIECSQKQLPPEQEKSLGIISRIIELMPKDGGKGGGQGAQNQQQNKNDSGKNDDKKDSGDKDLAQPPPGEEEKEKDEPKEDETESKEEEKEVDKDVESVLRKAKERTEEYEAEKKARMRKARLPPNERDW